MGAKLGGRHSAPSAIRTVTFFHAAIVKCNNGLKRAMDDTRTASQSMQQTAIGLPVSYDTGKKSAEATSNIKMFADIHRYLVQRHVEIESLRSMHKRKNQKRKD